MKVNFMSSKDNGDKRLTLSWRMCQSYKNHSIDLQGKSMDWFLYSKDHRHERVNVFKKL